MELNLIENLLRLMKGLSKDKKINEINKRKNLAFSYGNLKEIKLLIEELIKCPISGTNNWTMFVNSI